MKQKITFKSNVDGKVYQNLTEIGKTNQEIKIMKTDFIKLYTVKSDGCTDKSIELKLETNPFYYLNIPLCFTGVGLLAAYIDIANGSIRRTDKIVNVDLDCKGKK